MIRKCLDGEFEIIYEIINDSAQAFKGVIPMDCWKEPYMSKGELLREINEGVGFLGCEKDGELVGVMGIQHVQNVTLIRHAYVLTARWNQDFGGKLLSYLLTLYENRVSAIIIDATFKSKEGKVKGKVGFPPVNKVSEELMRKIEARWNEYGF